MIFDEKKGTKVDEILKIVNNQLKVDYKTYGSHTLFSNLRFFQIISSSPLFPFGPDLKKTVEGFNERRPTTCMYTILILLGEWTLITFLNWDLKSIARNSAFIF
jgi:hypothetical protein